MIRRLSVLICTAIVVVGTACGPKTAMNIHYTLPQPSQELSGKTIAVMVKDYRQDERLLGRAARAELHNFSGNSTFELIEKDGGRSLGNYDLVALFSTVLTQRLNNMGAVVVDVAGPNDPVLRVQVTTFKLDYEERTWKVAIGYRSQLVVNDAVVAEESISGDAERMKILGSGDADHVITLLFNDMVNKLDIVKMFADGRIQ